MLDISRSLHAAGHIRLERQACYKNALLTLLTHPDFEQGWYVEGFAVPVLNGVRLPFEHGWVELPDGSVIDVSYAALGLTEVAYFPAIRLSRRRAGKLVAAGVVLPHVLNDRSPRHRAAYRRAQRAAYQDTMAVTG